MSDFQIIPAYQPVLATVRFEAENIDPQALADFLASRTPSITLDDHVASSSRRPSKPVVASTSDENRILDEAILSLFAGPETLSRNKIIKILGTEGQDGRPGWPEAKISARIQRLVSKRRLILIDRGTYSSVPSGPVEPVVPTPVSGAITGSSDTGNAE